MWTLLAVLLMAGSAMQFLGPGERRMIDPYDSDRDPGDEDAPDALPMPVEPGWCMCPRNHVAYLRHRDQAIFCEVCSEVYLNADFARTYELDRAA